MSEDAETVIRDYYDALRDGAPLEAYFLEEESTVKFGISEGLFGFESVREALEEQTETTAEWTLESDHLVISEHGGVATFADEVTMAWTDTETGDRQRFETRWSGTLLERTNEDGDGDDETPEWLFATMHVSTAAEL